MVEQNQVTGFAVEEIDLASPYLEDVIKLWRVYSDTLGPFPRGAFEDHARKRQIIVAIKSPKKLVGYLAYRQTTRTASIVHLCIDEAFRGHGIARDMFAFLRNKVSHIEDIRLTCRRDYEASKLWPKLGFHPVYEKPGRGKDRKILTVWRYEIQRPPLLTAMYQSVSASKIRAVVDANVFYDLQDQTREETNGLLADFVEEVVSLCVTKEMHNEIDRHPNQGERQRRRLFMAEFEELSASTNDINSIYPELQKLHPKTELSHRDCSDLRQLSNAVACEAALFITRDELLLDLHDAVYAKFGINILRPCDVIIHLDELQREELYRPERLSGSRLMISRVQYGEYEKIIDLIQEPTPNARIELMTQLQRALSRPIDHECFLVKDSDGRYLAVYCLDCSISGQINVPILRLLSKNRLSHTVARYLVDKIMTTSMRKINKLVSISANSLQSEFIDSLKESSFFLHGPQWIKFCLPIIGNYADLANALREAASDNISKDVHDVARAISEKLETTKSPLQLHEEIELEKMFWPAKIINTNIHNFIVPIKAKWAQELFDTHLARQTLFGAHKTELILNTENVYYRASRPRVLDAPARVLWYVSRDEKYQGSMSVRACSYIDEVLIGHPKDLYRQFRRLGIYRWEDVFTLADRELDGELMAFRFSRTELFRQPIAWDTIQQVLVSIKGKQSQFQSPELISAEIFFHLYQLGTKEA